jgi:tetratricopeptide (TPR) repeat protein
VADHDALQHSGYPTPLRDERWYRAPVLAPIGDPSTWFATERDLIFTAVGDAHRRGDARLAAALLASATNLSDMSSAMVEWTELAERLLPDLRQRPDHIGEEAALLLAYGGNLLRGVRPEAALPPLRRARRMFQALDDAARAATSAVQIAVVHRRHGRTDLANAYLGWAIDRFAVAGHPPQEVQAHIGRGNLLLRAGCHTQAEQSYRTALALLRRHGESASVMYPNVLACLAEVLSVTGQHRQAVSHFHEAMAHAAGLGDRKQWAQVQLRLAVAHQRADNRMAAAQTARQAAQALDDLGLPARASQARQLLTDLDAAEPVAR